MIIYLTLGMAGNNPASSEEILHWEQQRVYVDWLELSDGTKIDVNNQYYTNFHPNKEGILQNNLQIRGYTWFEGSSCTEEKELLKRLSCGDVTITRVQFGQWDDTQQDEDEDEFKMNAFYITNAEFEIHNNFVTVDSTEYNRTVTLGGK